MLRGSADPGGPLAAVQATTELSPPSQAALIDTGDWLAEVSRRLAANRPALFDCVVHTPRSVAIAASMRPSPSVTSRPSVAPVSPLMIGCGRCATPRAVIRTAAALLQQSKLLDV